MAQTVGHAYSTDRKFEAPRHDWLLILSAVLLFIVGLSAIGSVAYAQGEATLVWRQLMNGALGLVVFLIFSGIKLDLWRRAAPFLYALNILMLGFVLVSGEGPGGVARWIDIGPIRFQPSELTKVLLALTLGAYYHKHAEDIRSPWVLAGAGLHVAPIVALVFLQPHNGAALGLLCVGLAAALYAGTPVKHFPVAMGAVAALIAVVWLTPGLMPAYAKNRITSAISGLAQGDKDEQGDHYQQSQAEIAIGSGGFSGTGFRNGPQIEAGTVPEQHNDFIFSAIAEEWGFIGSVVVLALFAFFFYRVWLATFRATSTMARVTAGCLFTILAFHTVVNLAMVLQLGPVVGLWLPFLSHGGTALWMCVAAVALIDQCGRN